jgi:hypothetical protein
LFPFESKFSGKAYGLASTVAKEFGYCFFCHGDAPSL